MEFRTVRMTETVCAPGGVDRGFAKEEEGMD
jgi:hypothetical protein